MQVAAGGGEITAVSCQWRQAPPMQQQARSPGPVLPNIRDRDSYNALGGAVLVGLGQTAFESWDASVSENPPAGRSHGG